MDANGAYNGCDKRSAMMRLIGLDAGSVSVKCVVIDEGGAILDQRYERHKGRPIQAAAAMLNELLAAHPEALLSCTGQAGKAVAGVLGAPHINELTAHAASTKRLFPEVNTIFEMGGEDSKLILLDGDAVKDFSMNSVCAAGTGSFLDQQAERMRLSIEEFSESALKSGKPPRIAGRCSVFAKSDMIHLQQIATPIEDIVNGLCFAVARNFQGAIVRNKPLTPKVAFMGGVALNQGVVRAFKEVFGLDELIIPEPPTVMGAYGAALKALDLGVATAIPDEALEEAAKPRAFSALGWTPLVGEEDDFLARHMRGDDPVTADLRSRVEASGEAVPAWLGIDIGSISTCLAVIDESGELLAKEYIRTASRPIEAVMKGFRRMQGKLGELVDVKGVGTTGSGRYMIADFIKADVVKNEITAQARGAAFIDPSVDTIFEIGGQDSKYIRMDNGVIVDFEMNKACAAGTGSFLEEQAEKLSVSVKGEFADKALSSNSPCRLGERCTVFMENSLSTNMHQGALKRDLLGGLAYSIVENYINRVVNGRPIGKNIFFQGGTAFNKAVVAAFEKFLDKKITVPPHHDNTGAIGMALIARDYTQAHPEAPTQFAGFVGADRSYSLKSFECKGCDNLCEINRVSVEGEKDKLFYGGRCEKYDIRRRKTNPVPDLFGFRAEMLDKAHKAHEDAFIARGATARRGVIGVPRIFFMHDMLPYYATLLWNLGFEVQVSPWTNQALVSLGVRDTLADSCFPIKAALGHIKSLLKQGVDRLFIPSFINMIPPEDPYEFGHACPLTQSFPYQARAAYPSADVVAPVVKLKSGPEFNLKELHKALKGYGVSKDEIRVAMGKAQRAQDLFAAALKDKGREALAMDEFRKLIVVGRGYNAFDMGMNLEIPKKLATLNVMAIPQDFLPEESIYNDWPELYWRSGQRIIKAARYIRKNPELNAVYIGNFSCGPDAFIFKYFERELGGKPYLHIEIDEHSADAGVVTRCEAFLDSLDMQDEKRLLDGGETATAAKIDRPKRIIFHTPGNKPRKIYIHRMCDPAHAVQAAFLGCGVEAEVMPETTPEALTLGRKFVSGKECYPFALTMGNMLAKAQSSEFERDRSAFLMFSGVGPCRFGQYNVLQRMLLDKAGFPDVPIVSPQQDADFYAELGLIGSDFTRKSWEGVIAYDLLIRLLNETRPYELTPGLSDELYNHWSKRLFDLMAGSKAALVRDGRLQAFLAEARRDFEAVPRSNEEKPFIGVVGEIYVRSNEFANEDLVRQIENLGGEAWLAPMDEWVFYTNWFGLEDAISKRQIKNAARIWLTNRVQQNIVAKLEKEMEGYLKTIHDPHTGVILKNAAPYVHQSFRGESILSVGKVVDMVKRGVHGIVNAMPFGCMPGTVVTSLLRRLSDEFDIPVVSIPYDGTQSPTTALHLEAFMEQARRRMRGKATV